MTSAVNGDSAMNGDHERQLHEAVSWHLRLHSQDSGEATFLEFCEWLDADPRNRAAYDKIEDFDAEITNSAMEEQPRLPRPLVSYLRPSSDGIRASLIRWSAAGVAGIAAAFLVVLAVRTSPPSAQQYATALGQSRTIQLSDGSVIEMNTATALSVQMDSSERRIVFNHGEAIFRVRHEQDHPFIVQVGDREVRDLGTVFDVVRDTGAVAVAVAEGQVAIAKPAGDPFVTIHAGERLKYKEGSTSSALDRIDPSWSTAWRSGYLVYRNSPLEDVVADLNRYFRVPIVLEGTEVPNERFSGVLRIHDESTAVAELTAFLGLTAVRDAKGRIRLQTARSKP